MENGDGLLALKGIILSSTAFKRSGEPKAEAEILVKTSPGTRGRKHMLVQTQIYTHFKWP